LLVDEIDRADEAFEALLLELLAEFQITIPELGTIRAKTIPHVVLTSNGSRELSDALKRRCLYHWIDYPDLAKELEIIRVKIPEIANGLSKEAVRYVHAVRKLELSKRPGIAETLDLSRSLLVLQKTKLDAEGAEETMGCILKSFDDFAKLRNEGIERILNRAGGNASAG
jgi:MoxR-like ATPase